jgi:hypothetical protein
MMLGTLLIRVLMGWMTVVRSVMVRALLIDLLDVRPLALPSRCYCTGNHQGPAFR